VSEAEKPHSMGHSDAPTAPAAPEKPIDIEDLKRLRRLGRKMMGLFEKLDEKVDAGIKKEGLKTSCAPGCAGCCYQLTLVTLPEAVAVAEHFLADVQRRQLIPLLMRSFFDQLRHIEVGDVGKIRQSYFLKKVPCTFLDLETKLCTIYPVRPAACRYHFVVSDPQLCQPESGNQSVAKVDVVQVDAEVLSEANRASNQAKVPLYIAPLPVAMLWAFKLLIEGRESFDLGMKDPDLGIMSLDGWVATLGRDELHRVQASLAGGTGAAP
jgi:Fe-S-cluster containining protein